MRVERFNHRAELDETTALVQQMKAGVRCLLSTVFTKVQKMVYDVFDAVQRKIQLQCR